MSHREGLSLELTRTQITTALLFACILLAFPGGPSSLSLREEANYPASLLDEIYAPFDTLRTDLRDYIWPTNASTTITSSFADYRRTHFHEGIDISTNKQRGYPVYATRDGYVRHIEVSRRGYGKMLSVRHRDGFVTLYAHLQKNARKNRRGTRLRLRLIAQCSPSAKERSLPTLATRGWVQHISISTLRLTLAGHGSSCVSYDRIIST